MKEILDVLRIILSLAFLTYASWSDFKKREVSNTVWVLFAPLAFLLTSLQLYTVLSRSSSEIIQQTLFICILSFFLIFALSYGLFYFGAFGGADAKALICIAIALPIYPVHSIQPWFGFVPLLFPLTAFSNGVIFASLSMIYAITRNLAWKLRTGKKLFEGFQSESNWRKTFALLCGYKVEAEKLEQNQYLYPIEDIEKEKSKLIVIPRDEKRGEIFQRILNATRQNEHPNEIWVTPGLPLLVFLTAGFIVALVLGDLVWILFNPILASLII